MASRRVLLCASALSVVATMGGSGAYAQDAKEANPAKDAAVSEVLVTGTRLATGFTTPTPVRVLGAESYEAQRAPTQLVDVLNDSPAFKPNGGASQGQYSTYRVGMAQLDLRGLGTVRTLPLLDGRRMVGSTIDGVADINLVPTSLIDRIEVVTGGASAAYGSDAVAGVVNLVLKKDLEGVRGSVQYGQTQRGDAKETAVGFAAGHALSDGRVHLTAGADYAHGGGSGTMYSRAWGREEPGFFAAAGGAAGVPATFILPQNTFVGPPGGVIRGGPLSGTAFGPGGVSQPYKFGSPLGLTEQSGTSNYGYNELSNQYLRGPFERYSGLVRVDAELTPTVKAFVQVMSGRLTVDTKSTFFSTAIPILGNNPLIPVDTRAAMNAAGVSSFVLNRTFTEWGPTQAHNKNEMLGAVVGLEGEFGEGWHWDASYQSSRDVFDFFVSQVVLVPNLISAATAVGATPGTATCLAPQANPLLSANQKAAVQPGCVPFNVFGPNAASSAALDYVLDPLEQKTDQTLNEATFNLRGEPFALPAGPVAIAAGVSYRENDAKITVPDYVRAHSLAGAYVYANPLPADGNINVKEAYLEAQAPLIADRPLVKSLVVNGAVRFADYSTTGGATTWKLGLNYEPTDYLRFRAVMSRDIRAPNISELFVNDVELYQQLANPLTGAATGVRTQILANPDLKPEKADSYTVGVVFQPDWAWARGFRASVDYFNIDISNVVSTIGANEVLRRFFIDKDPAFAKYVSLSSTVPTGFDKVFSPRINANTLKTDGVDIELSYKIPELPIPGALDLSASGTWTNTNRVLDNAGSVPKTVEYVGAYIPEWRWTANIAYRWERLRTNLQVRYNSSTKFGNENTIYIGPNDPQYQSAVNDLSSPLHNLTINKESFPAAVYFTLSGSYDLIDGPGRKLQAFVVVDNLFDKDPPFGAFTLAQVAANYYDTVGRSYKVGLRFSF